MDIHLIWATDDGIIWLVGAWDDETVAENYKGWEEELAKHREAHGADNIRVGRASIDWSRVEKLFEVPSLGELK